MKNERARHAYEIIQTHSAKTAFITDAVLSYMEDNKNIDKKIIKKAFKEVIIELGLDINIKDATKNEDVKIPDDLFNMLSGL
jgi:hypothetical protein